MPEKLVNLVSVLDDLELGDDQQVGNAHFVPLLIKDPGQVRDYITPHEAIKAGMLELRDSGHIDALIAINQGDTPILFIAGMDVHAEGTQSRIVIGSHLVPPKAKIELPCRCTHDVHPIRKYQALMTDVEHYNVAPPSIRARTLFKSVAGQHDVWSKIQEHREKLKRTSVRGKPVLATGYSSSRLSEVQEEAIRPLRDKLAKIKAQPRQVGLAVVSEGEVQTIEVFGNPKTYHLFHKNLKERFAAEITAPKPTPGNIVKTLCSDMLKELQQLSRKLKVKDGSGALQTKNRVITSLQNKDHQLVHFVFEKL